MNKNKNNLFVTHGNLQWQKFTWHTIWTPTRHSNLLGQIGCDASDDAQHHQLPITIYQSSMVMSSIRIHFSIIRKSNKTTNYQKHLVWYFHWINHLWVFRILIGYFQRHCQLPSDWLSWLIIYMEGQSPAMPVFPSVLVVCVYIAYAVLQAFSNVFVVYCSFIILV